MFHIPILKIPTNLYQTKGYWWMYQECKSFPLKSESTLFLIVLTQPLAEHTKKYKQVSRKVDSLHFVNSGLSWEDVIHHYTQIKQFTRRGVS